MVRTLASNPSGLSSNPRVDALSTMLVVGFLSLYVSLQVSTFPLSSKTNIFKFHFIVDIILPLNHHFVYL